MGKVVKFWAKVLLRSLRTTWRLVSEHVVTALILLVSLILASYFSANGIIDQAIVQGYLSDASSSARFLTGLSLIALFWFLINVVYQPAKMYDELGAFAEKGYELSPEPHPDPVGTIYYARAINIKTTTPFDVEECQLKLLEARNIKGGKNILRRPENFTWSDREGSNKTEPKTITGNGQSRLCNVAHWYAEKKEALFTLAFGPQQRIPD